jgi:Flp pilus assembly protein TadD
VLAGAWLAVGCAGARRPAVAEPDFDVAHHDGPPPAVAAPGAAGDLAPATVPATAPVSRGDGDPRDSASLEQYIARVRAISQRAGVPRARSSVSSLEDLDPTLRAALDRLSMATTPEGHHAVAAAYLRAGIVDQAFTHFTAALRIDRTDATAYDALARIWRDWGFAHLGLTDAHRAVYFAPRSAAARNTLGTLLQAMGLTAEARRAYAMAVTLDADAAYALNNLCSLDLAEGRLADARATCRRALAIDPSLLAARRNLAMVSALQPVDDARSAERGSADGTIRPPHE